MFGRRLGRLQRQCHRDLEVDRQLVFTMVAAWGCYLQTMGTLSSADFITIVAESWDVPDRA
jgi:hypothetical protein